MSWEEMSSVEADVIWRIKKSILNREMTSKYFFLWCCCRSLKNVLLIFLGVSEKHLSCALTKNLHKFWWLDLKESFISTNSDTWSFPSTVATGHDGFRLECYHSSDTQYLHFLLGNHSTVFQSLRDLAEESSSFNFLLYPYTGVYYFRFRSGSLYGAPWTQFYNWNTHIIPLVSAVGQ